jgi:hypothetical protein
MVSLKKLLAVTAVGALMATPAFAQTTGGTGGGVGAGSTGAAPGIGAPGVGTPGTTRPGGGLTPATPPSASPTLEPTPSTLPPRPTESTPAPGLNNPTGAIPGTPGIGGATSAPLPQGGTMPSTTPGSSTIQR